MTAITDLAASIPDSVESLRASITDPADQIRTLLDFASYGLITPASSSSDPVGIAGFRSAGTSGTWANTTRSTAATYLDGTGMMQTAPAGTVRPLYSGSVLTGFINEPAATNLMPRSTTMVSTYYGAGANSIDLGMVTAPDGTLSARRIRSGPSGPANVYLNRIGLLPVSANTTYTASVYLRCNVGTLTAGGALTVDEYNSSSTFITRNGTTSIASLGSTWRRYSRTFTTGASTASLSLYLADNWTVGAEVEAWGFQLETGTTATSLIYTTATAVIRAADNVILATPGTQSPIAAAQATAAAAVTALIRRAALISLARAIAIYEPRSSAEARAVLDDVMPLYDAEIIKAGDANDNQSYMQLRSLRAAVSRDLQQRGLQLPEVIQVNALTTRPSLVSAHQLYGDSTRELGLVQRAGPEHPLFMPTSYEALSS